MTLRVHLYGRDMSGRRAENGRERSLPHAGRVLPHGSQHTLRHTRAGRRGVPGDNGQPPRRLPRRHSPAGAMRRRGEGRSADAAEAPERLLWPLSRAPSRRLPRGFRRAAGPWMVPMVPTVVTPGAAVCWRVSAHFSRVPIERDGGGPNGALTRVAHHIAFNDSPPLRGARRRCVRVPKVALTHTTLLHSVLVVWP